MGREGKCRPHRSLPPVALRRRPLSSRCSSGRTLWRVLIPPWGNQRAGTGRESMSNWRRGRDWRFGAVPFAAAGRFAPPASLVTLFLGSNPLAGSHPALGESTCRDRSGKHEQLAERAGFEPAVRCYPYDGLANRSFRPLRHLSAGVSTGLKIVVLVLASTGWKRKEEKSLRSLLLQANGPRIKVISTVDKHHANMLCKRSFYARSQEPRTRTRGAKKDGFAGPGEKP